MTARNAFFFFRAELSSRTSSEAYQRLTQARPGGEERERERDGVLGRARQLRLPTMAAQGGLHLRVSSRREKRQVERERLKGGALLGVTLCGAPPRREKREREKQKEAHRPKNRPLLASRADLFFPSLRLAARVR